MSPPKAACISQGAAMPGAPRPAKPPQVPHLILGNHAAQLSHVLLHIFQSAFLPRHIQQCAGVGGCPLTRALDLRRKWAPAKPKSPANSQRALIAGRCAVDRIPVHE